MQRVYQANLFSLHYNREGWMLTEANYRSLSPVWGLQIVLLLLFFAAATAVDDTSCASLVQRYLVHSYGDTAIRVRQQRNDAIANHAEAQRCTLHPPSTEKERAMGFSEYVSYCSNWTAQASDDLIKANEAKESHASSAMQLAIRLRESCVAEASTESNSTITIYARVLAITGREVLSHIFTSYSKGALEHFASFVEVSARRAYALYLRLINSRVKRSPDDFHGVVGQTSDEERRRQQHQAQSGTSKRSNLETVLRTFGLLIPNMAKWVSQLFSMFLGPVLLLGMLASILVLMLPVLLGYFLLGEVMLMFWVRVLFVEGTLSELLRTHDGSYLVVVNALVAHHTWEVFFCCVGAVAAVFLFAVASFPWYGSVYSLMIPGRRQ